MKTSRMKGFCLAKYKNPSLVWFAVEIQKVLLLAGLPEMNIADQTHCFASSLFTNDIEKIRSIKKVCMISKCKDLCIVRANEDKFPMSKIYSTVLEDCCEWSLKIMYIQELAAYIWNLILNLLSNVGRGLWI